MNSEKLVLIDIFTYSCMNCLRSLKYIKKIDDKYKKYGLKTVLMHPHEWSFEKKRKNIANELKRSKIKFRWKTASNKLLMKRFRLNFWPSQVLMRGSRILYKHTGEGDYRKLEKTIIKALKLKTGQVFKKEPGYSKIPSVYAGKKKNGKVKNIRKKMDFWTLYTAGKWKQKHEYLESSGKDNCITLMTKGKVVNFVAESLGNIPVKVKVMLSKKNMKTIMINEPRMYNLLKLRDGKQKRLTIVADKIKIYSFSFE
jgi:hypothetical protein